MSKTAGFTFLELMVSLAIISIILSVALPGLFSWRSGVRLREATYYLKGDLEFAKSSAIKENVSVGVQFTSGSYTIFVDNGAGGGTAGDMIQNGTERLVRRRLLPAGVNIDLDATDFADERTGFNSRGLATTDDGTISLRTSNDSRQVVLNRLGRLSIN